MDLTPQLNCALRRPVATPCRGTAVREPIRRRVAEVKSYRFATYIVISKPKRISAAVGVAHFMVKLLLDR
jgi:hypothetical protein